MAPEMAGALLTIVCLVLALLGALVMLLSTQEKAKATSFQAAVDVERLSGEALYWRTRCEQMADAALIRAGAVPGPVMHTHPTPPKDPMTQLLSGLSVGEIDSTRKGAA